MVAVPTNDGKQSALEYCEKQMLDDLAPISEIDTDWGHRGVILIQANISTTKLRESTLLIPKEEDRIRILNHRQLKTVGNLYAVIGAPYLVTQNIDVSNGVANGTLSILHDVVLQDNVKPRIVHCGGNRFVHSVYASEVKCLVYKHCLRGLSEERPYPSLPSGCFPVVPAKFSSNQKIKGNCISISTCQFPCVSALVLTGHRVQGQTMNSIILGDISNSYKKGEQGWLYVLLSRVRTLSGLFTLFKLDLDLSAYKPRKDIMKEMARLEDIETETLKQLQSSKKTTFFNVKSNILCLDLLSYRVGMLVNIHMV